MLTLLNLNAPEQTAHHKRAELLAHYRKRRKHAHRIRLVLETLSTVCVAIETRLLFFGLISLVWTLVDVTMLLADDAD
jgi:hypothetical protein